MSSASSVTEPVYILITQCLQNNFFLSEENRLRIPSDQALPMLLKGRMDTIDGQVKTADETNELQDFIEDKLKRNQDKKALEKNKRIIKKSSDLKEGPLYQFLQSTIGLPERKNEIHMVNIRDWHKPSESYDLERRRYGSHCEAGSWEADYVEGFDKFLIPMEKTAITSEAIVRGHRENKNVFYDVRSNSLYDFQPNENDNDESDLTKILDKLLLEGDRTRRAYVVVIGVLTDIKIKLLLVALRSRYNIENLIISDVLTASATLERHLSGLDFADKVLNVDIVHNLNALASALHPQHADDIPHDIIDFRPDFKDYRSYYLDKQNVLAYQDQQLLRYVELTGKRGADVYSQIFNTNKMLTLFGFSFLLVTLVMGVLKFTNPEKYSLDIVILTGGLSIAQLVAVFFTRPMGQIQKNLMNLVRLRNYLETYSTVTALLRHHLTTPERLQTNNIDDLKQQLAMIQDMAKAMSANFSSIELSQDLELKELSALTPPISPPVTTNPPTPPANEPTPPSVAG